MKNIKRKLLHLFFVFILAFFFASCGSGTHNEAVNHDENPSSNLISWNVPVFPASPDTPYKDILEECVYPGESYKLPPLYLLPMIGQEYESITIEL